MTPLDWKIERVKRGMPRHQVAKAIGISVRMLVYFEHDKRELPPEKLAALEQFYREHAA